MQSVQGRQESKLVVLNRYNQPIGPTNTVVTELGSFLGTLARNAMHCALNIHNWKNMDTKKDLWDYTQEKYDIPDSAKKWALDGIKNARRKYKNDLYRNHYKAYANDDLRMANKPKDVSESDFKDLLKYWDSEKFKESPDELSTKEHFVATRSRKSGRVYKDSNEDTISKITEMEKMQSRQNEDDNQSFDAFTAVMGHEHPGCMRLYGRGVTKSTFKRKALSEPYLSANDERIEKNGGIGREDASKDGGKIRTTKTMLASMGAQSPQEAMQPLNRPSSSKNHQGGEDNQGDDESSDEDLIT
ncbi:hypothetical protein KY285_023798 [Solanum tuberosum]|nr:hypothetical protein KY289_024130 [Solanum tuberosum]KAH0675997.1 hypothetical protein KY285_023798 [Solanum tuberosum]